MGDFVPTLLTLSSILCVMLLHWHVRYLFVEAVFYAVEKCQKREKRKRSKKGIKTQAPMFEAIILISHL